jgi:hypothetical protein
MVFNVEPVADIFTASIYRQGAMAIAVQDDQWDQFLREMIGPVVVRAVRDKGWQSVGAVPSLYKMVGAGFGGGIG